MMSEEGKNKKPEQIRFIYQKARHHRTFHADGAWAGITPLLEVQFAFFNDLRPMPDEVAHEVSDDGLLGKELARQHEPENIIREANVTVVMNVSALREVIKLLDKMANQIEEAVAARSAPVSDGEAKEIA